jgi:ubiquinol-cytochrome c reductase cytochrome c subunit
VTKHGETDMTSGIDSGASGAVAVRRRRRVPAAAFLLLALVLTGVAWALFSPSGQAANTGNDAAIAQGKELFANGCSSCHGFAGEGVTGRGPALVGVGGAAVDFQVSSGRMPLADPGLEAGRHKSNYTQAQVDQLAAYVQTLGGGPAQVSVTDAMIKNANVPLGGEIFRANCASCHNYAGTGNALDKGRYAPNLNHATPTQIYEAMLSGPEFMPVFGDKQISPQQKVDVAAYILSLQHGKDPGGANLGNVGPVPEGLVIFIVGIGGCVAFALWIGARR